MKKRFQKALQDKDFAELLKGSGISFILRFGGLAVGFLLTLDYCKFILSRGY